MNSNKVVYWINSNKVAYWINSNKSYITLHKRHVCQLYMFLNMSYHYITFGNASSTTTIVLPLNGANSNLLSSMTPAFVQKSFCSIQKVKFLLVLVLNDSIQVPTEWGPDLDTSIPSFKRSQQEFNLLNGTKELPGECWSLAV